VAAENLQKIQAPPGETQQEAGETKAGGRYVEIPVQNRNAGRHFEKTQAAGRQSIVAEAYGGTHMRTQSRAERTQDPEYANP